jgi:hypothetical protein
MYFKNKQLTSTEITDLYNGGSGKFYADFPSDFFELTASNYFNGTAITNFNATITNATTTQTISTTNGSIYWILDDIVNITVEAEDYFDRNFTNYNTSTDLDAELWQSVLNLYLTDLTNATFFDGVNWTVNNTGGGINLSKTNQSAPATFYVNAGTYDIFSSKFGFPDGETSTTVSTEEEKDVYVSIGFSATINLIDEATWEPFNVSETNQTRVSVVCEDIGSFSHVFTNSSENITIDCIYTKLRFTVVFDDVSYTRNLLFSELETFEQNIYLLDLTTTQPIYNNFIVNDFTGEYKDPELYVLKNREEERVVIHSDKLDVENSMATYLIENDEYILELRSSNNPKEVL